MNGFVLVAVIGVTCLSPKVKTDDYGKALSTKIEIERVDLPKYYQHGNLIVNFANKKSVTLNSTKNAMDVHIFPDKRTIGWVEGEMSVYHKDPWFFPKSLIIWKDGKVIRKIAPDRYIVGWGIAEDGKKVAIATEGMHGPTFMLLYDVKSGKVLGSAKNFDKNKKSWVKSIPEHNGPWYN